MKRIIYYMLYYILYKQKVNIQEWIYGYLYRCIQIISLLFMMRYTNANYIS